MYRVTALDGSCDVVAGIVSLRFDTVVIKPGYALTVYRGTSEFDWQLLHYVTTPDDVIPNVHAASNVR